VAIGGERVVVMAGPCSVESREQIERCAEQVARRARSVIRGGAFKPRIFALQLSGDGRRGPAMLRAAADRNGLLVVSEVMDQTQIPLVASIPIFCKWARATCRTSTCCANWASCASRCC
jgi:3-deoxy-7-phosphoheptulonate synthase